MRLEPPARATLVGQYLGPLFAQRGIGTLILDWDHNWDEYQPPLQVLPDSAAPRYTAGVAWQCYGGDVSARGPAPRSPPVNDPHFTRRSGRRWCPHCAA